MLSSLLNRFAEPETLKMAKLGRELRAKGIDITDLSLGEPDFDTPEHIKAAAKKAIDDNYSHYPPVPGYADLREAICKKFKRDNGLDYAAENIVVSTGAKQCIANLILSVVDKGDEVIIPTPYWVTYSALVELAEGTVKFIKGSVDNGFKITAAQLEEAITPKTKLFMFSSPCNPSGALYSEEELAALVKVFEKYPQVLIMSDEIYEHINFVGKHHSIASFPSVKDRVIIINGLSKAFAMTGWRLGFLAAETTIAKACEKVQGQFTSGANSIAQRAAIAALTEPMQPTEDMVAEFKSRRALIMQKLAEMPGVKCSEPPAAFYVFPDMSAFFGKKTHGGKEIGSAGDLSTFLLEEANVTSVSGSAFGEPNCIRFSFANSEANIIKGMDNVKAALAQLR